MRTLKLYIKKILKFFGINFYTKKQKRVLGKKIQPRKSKLDSVFLFTTHKCASNFISKMLINIENETDYIHYDYGYLVGGFVDKLGIIGDYETYMNSNHKNLFSENGEIYGPQRKPLNFSGIENYKKIFFLRDPRDVLVSAYYSFGKTHKIPNQKKIKERFLKERNRINKISIDEYAIEQAEQWLLPIYKNYELHHRSESNSIYLSYDSYKDNTVVFLEEMFDFLKISLPNLAIGLSKEANAIQNSINHDSHQRSGKSNQWKTELTLETQKRINIVLKDTLKYWGFSKD